MKYLPGDEIIIIISVSSEQQLSTTTLTKLLKFKYGSCDSSSWLKTLLAFNIGVKLSNVKQTRGISYFAELHVENMFVWMRVNVGGRSS